MPALRRQTFEDLLHGRELTYWKYDDIAEAAGP